MRIAVFGTGGVGGYFGGRLAQIGQDVTFIARNKSLDAMRERGLRVDSIAGDFTLPRVEVTDDPRKVGVVDYVLCCVKAGQVAAAGKAMLPMVGPETLVVPLQNGIEAPARLGETLDPANVLGGLCGIVSFLAAPGHIKHTGASPLIRFGHLDNRPDPRVNSLAEIFNHCSGVKASIPEDINVAMWQKFMLVTPWSGLGAVSRAPIGALLAQHETREMLLEAVEEVDQLARAMGISLPANSVEKTIRTLESMPPNSTTSMQRDIVKGRPSELDVLNGTVVRLAEEHGLDARVNRFCLYCMRSLELRARGALKFNRRSTPR